MLSKQEELEIVNKTFLHYLQLKINGKMKKHQFTICKFYSLLRVKVNRLEYKKI